MKKEKEVLTQRQGAILKFIKRFQSKHGYPPTRAEIQLQFMFSSQNAVTDHLKAIEGKGWITILPNIARGIKIK
jgi:repressor LexA